MYMAQEWELSRHLITSIGRREMGLMNGEQKFHFVIGSITGFVKIYFLLKIYNRVFKYFMPF